MAMPPDGNRKRQRSNYEDEVSEFTPLSKRINNLHINNSLVKQLQQHGEISKNESHRGLVNERLNEFEYGSSRNVDANMNGDSSESWNENCYNPDMTPAENPFYYDSNRLLFELYLERSQRTNNPQSPSTSHNHF